MHKIIVKILAIISISSKITAYSGVTITSTADWDLGTASNGLTTGQTGAIRLTSGFVSGFDDFDGGIKPWWTIYTSAVLGTGNVLVSGNQNRNGLWSQGFAGEQDFDAIVNIYAACTYQCPIGGLGVEAGAQVIEIAVSNQTFFFPGATGGTASIVLPSGWCQLHLKKVGQTYSGECRAVGNATWTYLGARSVPVATQVLFLGNHYAIQNPPTYSYVDNFEVKPIISQGSWTSGALNLGGAPTTQGSIKWSQDLPTGTHVEIQTATSTDGTNWSGWSDVYIDNYGSVITSPNRQYIRVAATLKADINREFSPVLKDITIVYPDAVPSKPTVASLTHPVGIWSNINPLQISWSMPSSNPAPEASFKYWLAVGGTVTQTATGTGLTVTAGIAHPLTITLPQEGQYTFGLTVTADAFSGGLTSTSLPYAFNFDATAPGSVTIISPTHPALLFTNNNSPVFKLSAVDTMSGISGYATVLDKAPVGEPGYVVNNGEDIRFSRLDNGTYYLHARAIDLAGNTGPASHYGIRVDFNGALLSQDYVKALPNPVRSNSAQLQYELAAPATEVYLEFMNSQGELLKTVDGTRIVGKNYYNWDVSGLANGVYLFRVKAKSSEDGKAYSVVRKVAVIR